MRVLLASHPGAVGAKPSYRPSAIPQFDKEVQIGTTLFFGDLRLG
jgi:hypothetical protein